ncbi:MAG: T9SS type A sorting domain-containing protein [Bacteroidales bacterium]|jgi:hypothetical protein|nr:T9SS type A sorting domain-containing protein [Bacteroidales bacterium]
MKNFTRIFTLLIAIILVLSAQAQNKSDAVNKSAMSPDSAMLSDMDTAYFDLNYVEAPIKSYGTLFQDSSSRYTVPADSGTTSIFSASLWIGGKNESGELCLAAERFNQHGFDFYPGPLRRNNNPGTTDSLTSEAYNHVWKIDRSEIEYLNYAFENNISVNIPDNIANWPAHGPQDYSQNLAPFHDENNNGIYEPNNGELPDILGDQMLYWITNDNTKPHTESGGQAMGIELHHKFYGFRFDNPQNEFDDLINYQTFYNLQITNASENQYDSVYFGVWVDGDIGNAYDDYLGCDVQLNSFYFYNGDDFDEGGYQNDLPVQTVTVLNSPLLYANGQDDDGDGIIDNEQIGMSKFMYFNNSTGGNPATTDPVVGIEYYNYMQGIWEDNTPLYYGGAGHFSSGATDVVCDYAFPGDTDPTGIGTGGIIMPPWSEESSGTNPPDDRRGILSMGPITLLPGDTVNIDLLFGFLPSANGGKTTELNYRSRLDSLITWFHEARIPSNYLAAEYANISSDAKHNTKLYPNPATSHLYIDNFKAGQSYEIFDSFGRKVMSGNYQGKINLNDLTSGMYFIRYEAENQLQRKSFILM